MIAAVFSSRLPPSTVAALVVALLAVPAVGQAAAPTRADLQRDLKGLLAAKGGPPGAVVTLYRNGKMTVLRAGRADVTRKGAPGPRDHMRIASVSKAYSGAVALHLVANRQLGLDDAIAQRLPGAPPAWGAVTVRQMLNHTGGLPDYSKSKGFERQLRTNPRRYVSPQKVINWVRGDPLQFAPGSSYEYSNTDNIVIGLIAEAVTGKTYPELLDEIVFGPTRLSQTSLPTAVALPSPFIHGYIVAPGQRPEDVSRAISPSGAWASGGIVSTPANLNAFIRADLAQRYFGAAEQREQMRFVPGGESSPKGPGRNSAGLALFRYQTKCGTVFGHTGDFPGYVQFAAATADGSRAVTTSLNIPAPTGRLLAQLRAFQQKAICALLKG